MTPSCSKQLKITLELETKKAPEKKDEKESQKQPQKAVHIQGDSVLHYTVSIGHKENVEKLLKHGMRVQHQSSADGATPLHRAAQIGSIEIAMVLLNHGADINSTNYLGQTPLHVALEKEFTDFAKFLISKGARKKCKHNCMRCKIFNDSINKNSKQYNESKPRRNRRNKQNRREAIESPFYIDHDQLQDHLVVESETPNKSCKNRDLSNK